MSQFDTVYERIEGDIGSVHFDGSDSEIRQYFDNQSLFITGVTGYLGKCLIEKFLRSCPTIKNIYVLMREQKKESLKERAKKYFLNEIFDPLRKEFPDFEKKVIVMKGDLMSKNLGMSDEDRDTILNNVNIIYHNAANVKFDIRISVSLRVNVLGTREMLELARKCKNLKLFMYISTAYSHCYRKDIEETFYPSPTDLKNVNYIIETDEKLENGLEEEQLQKIIGKFPNIYTYSKAIAEDVVRQYAQNSTFPHAIYRPSIVISAWKEPLVGWCGNTNGPVYIFMAYLLGYIRAAYHHGYPMDFIPSDLTVNALLAITPDAQNQWKKDPQQELIYNYGSSTTNPISFVKAAELCDAIPANERSPRAVWLSGTVMTSHKWLFYILHILLHFIPACLVDAIRLLSGKKPRVVSIFWKATQHLDKIDYFGNGNWRIHMPRTLRVLDKMKPADQEIFFSDIRTFSWKEYSVPMLRGLRRYILKEELHANNAGRRKYILLWYLHYGFIAAFFSVLFYFFVKTIAITF